MVFPGLTMACRQYLMPPFHGRNILDLHEAMFLPNGKLFKRVKVFLVHVPANDSKAPALKNYPFSDMFKDLISGLSCVACVCLLSITICNSNLNPLLVCSDGKCMQSGCLPNVLWPIIRQSPGRASSEQTHSGSFTSHTSWGISQWRCRGTRDKFPSG